MNITMSFGVAELSSHTDVHSPSQWIHRADTALYTSKQSGRNQTTLAPLLRPSGSD